MALTGALRLLLGGNYFSVTQQFLQRASGMLCGCRSRSRRDCKLLLERSTKGASMLASFHGHE